MNKQSEEDVTQALALIGAALWGSQEEGVLALLSGAEALLERALGVESLADELESFGSALVS